MLLHNIKKGIKEHLYNNNNNDDDEYYLVGLIYLFI